MQNLFIKPDDEIVVDFFVAQDKDDTLFADITKESLTETLEAMNRDVKDFTIGEYRAVFKKPSFGDSSKLYDEIFSLSDSGLAFNPVLARYNKIIALIKSWNLTGEDRKPTEEEIRNLHPVIANTIGIILDLQVGGIFD